VGARWATDGSSAARRRCSGWRDLEGLTDNVNLNGGEPHRPGAQHREVTNRGGQSDLSKKITVDVKARSWS